MSKERLEEIKNHQGDADKSNDEYEYEKINFYNLHVDWLIEQAERVQELEEREKELININQHEMQYRAKLETRNVELEHQNKRYREALEEIINARNYFYPTEYVFGVEGIARKALEGDK